MLKKIMFRFFIGFVAATFLGYCINIIISLAEGGGSYLTAMPVLLRRFDNEISAVIAQFFMIGMIGVAFSEASLIFRIERWSFLRQCIVHFFSTAVIYVPFSCLCWFPLQTNGIYIMLANILVTYIINWLIQYKVNCKNVAEINRKLQEVHSNERDQNN